MSLAVQGLENAEERAHFIVCPGKAFLEKVTFAVWNDKGVRVMWVSAGDRAGESTAVTLALSRHSALGKRWGG